MCRWLYSFYSGNAGKTKTDVTKKEHFKYPTRSASNFKDVTEVFMLPGPRSKVHLTKTCLGATKSVELSTFEVCKHCCNRALKDK